MPDCRGLHSAQRAVECLLNGYCDVLVRSLYVALLFLAEWMTGCMRKIILIRLLAALPHRLDGVGKPRGCVRQRSDVT